MNRGGVSRQRTRGAALQVLFALDVRKSLLKDEGDSSILLSHETTFTGLVEEVINNATDHMEIPQASILFLRELVDGVYGSIDIVDGKIGEWAKNWRLERMSVVDRNILRIAVWEIIEGTTPPAVAIDEAVELARRFGGDRSPAFVNGILDSVANEAQGH
jgi:N utilization substance protein B